MLMMTQKGQGTSPASVLCHCPKYIQQCQCPSVPQQSYGHLYCLSSEKIFVTRIYINVTKLSDVKGWQLSQHLNILSSLKYSFFNVQL